VVWGAETAPEVRALADAWEAPVWHMEDGFLRSVGLGSDLVAPASLVIDRRGMYFDPRGPSDLEDILEHGEIGAEDEARAARLRERIVREGLSKYNVGSDRAPAIREEAAGRRVLLVVGQVEDDASIRLGCVDVRRNADLLARVREAHPEAYLLWKPHPDVVSGNRVGHVPDAAASGLCDREVRDLSIGACLGLVDEVHTMTSLVGFEALLRGLPVVTYGLPFYAGWGLTRDRHASPRRTRPRALDALVAAVLLRYPLYVSPETRERTSPEAILDFLGRRRAAESAGALAPSAPSGARLLHKLRNLWNVLRRHG